MLTGRVMRRGGALAIVLALAAPPIATATWTESTITETTRFDEPSLALDATDRSHVAYIGYGAEPGVYLATDTTGDWVSTRLTNTTDDAPALALDAAGHRHIVFVRYGDDPGVHYATDRSGSWVVTRLTSERADSPSIAVDPAGHVHIAFNSDTFEPGIIALDDTRGTWTRTRVTDAHLDGATSIVALPDGSTRIAFARYAPEAPGIYVAASSDVGGTWDVERLTSAYDDEPSLAVRADDAVDLAFVRFQADGRGLYHASATGGDPWSVTPVLVDADRDVDRPSIAVGRDGMAVIAYSQADSNGDVFGIFEARQLADGRWDPERPVTSDRRPDDWPSLALDASDAAHIAFAELDTGPNPGVYVRDADTFDLVAASTVDSDVSMAELDDGPVIAYRHVSGDGEAGVRYARRTSGVWAYEDVSRDASRPSVVVDDARHARIFTDDVELSDRTGSWRDSPLALAARDVRASRGADGDLLLAYVDRRGKPAVASNRSGGWEAATAYFGYDGEGAVTADATGRIHWAIAGPDLVYETARALDGPWTETRLGTQAADPSIAVDHDGMVHIVWRRTGSDEGTYYTTDASGAWVTTRLTRTSADGPPALALDSTGHVSVAMVRSSRAANPGLYLVSNRTGTWVTTRIDGAFDAMSPQLSISDAGRATIVLGRADGAGLRAYEGTAASRPTVDVGGGRGAIDIEDQRMRGGRLTRAGVTVTRRRPSPRVRRRSTTGTGRRPLPDPVAMACCAGGPADVAPRCRDDGKIGPRATRWRPGSGRCGNLRVERLDDVDDLDLVDVIRDRCRVCAHRIDALAGELARPIRPLAHHRRSKHRERDDAEDRDDTERDRPARPTDGGRDDPGRRHRARDGLADVDAGQIERRPSGRDGVEAWQFDLGHVDLRKRADDIVALHLG